MSQDSCFSSEVTDFRKLGTGHKRRKVVVADENQHICFSARILHNRPLTTGKLWFDNNRSFDFASRTLGGQKVSIFFWNEDLERCWQRQLEIERISRWLEEARPEDVIVFGGFVAQESGRRQFWNHPFVFVLAKQDVSR